MNKLQLYITRSGSGFKSLFNHNPNEDVRRHVHDLRKALSLINYDSEEKNIFYMLSAIAEGLFITVIRTIPPQQGHHLAAWIFVPAGLQIADTQLEEIVRLTTRKVSNPEVSHSDVAELREAFNVEYPAMKNPPAITPGAGTEYAWRLYGGQTGLSLLDFCGRGLYQQCYIPYAGVLLIDADLDCTADAADLTDVPLGEEAVILPPEKSDEGFTAHVFGRVLDRPLRATLGATVDVVWKRAGFEDVAVEETVSASQFVPRNVSTIDSHKLITPQSFNITSQVTHDPVEGCSIRVNGHDISGEGREFTPDELRKASVLISCEGFFPYSGTLDLASTTRALIQLQERRKVYRFELPVISSDLGGPVKFEIRTKRELTESPLEGYSLLDDIQEGPTRTNHLGFVGASTSFLQKAGYVLAGIVVGVLGMWALSTCSGNEDSSAGLAPGANPDSIVDTTVEVPPVITEGTVTKAEIPQAPAKSEQTQAPAKTNPDDNAAVKYLDDNNVWSRQELESYSLTRGLYDDMNAIDVDRLANFWGPKLGSSKNFARIVEHAKMGRHKKKRKEAPYNSESDTKISVQGFLNTIDP